jgi:Skp family chaperone for outer membrane proteins
MCEECFKPHNDYPGFQDHLVLTMEELSKPENQSKIKNISKCTQHPKKKLKYYCDTCNQLICRHCMDFDHDKQHKFLPLEQAAQNKRKDLKKNCEMLERTVRESNKNTHKLKNVSQSLNRNFDAAQRLLNERKQELLAKLQERIGTKMNSMMDTVCQTFGEKTVLITWQITKAETSVNRVKASADMAHSLLENANDEEIIRSFQSVQENVNSANKEVRPDNCTDDNVLPWRVSEVDEMLLAEIRGFVQDESKGNYP